jgi:hypothetical protein
MNKANWTLSILLLLSISAVPSYAEQEQERTYEKAYIEWKPAEGALSYTVEVMDIYDDLILKKTTEALKLELSLPYGKYKYRVGMLTKFNKVSGWTEWRTLMIVPALEPRIISTAPATLSAGPGNRVTIKGKNFYRSSEVIIKNAEAQLEVKDVRLMDQETLSVTVDAAGAKPGGTFDLTVKNPGDLLDLEAVAPKQFTITGKPSGPANEYYLGLESGYYSPNLGVKDAYSGSFGIKLFTEFRSLGRSHPALSFLNKAPGFYPGALLSVFGFLKPESGFGSSTMMQLGLYFGYEFSFPLKGELQWHVSPLLGYKQYFRWHTFGGSDYFGTKPILFIGGNVNFDLPMKFFIGLGLEYNAIFDLKPAHAIGVFVRCGYRL